MFSSAGYSLLRAEGFFCSLNVLWVRIRIGNIFSLKCWIRNRNTVFSQMKLRSQVQIVPFAATRIVWPLYLDWSACNSFAGAATRSLGLGFAFSVILCCGIGAPHLQHRSQYLMNITLLKPVLRIRSRRICTCFWPPGSGSRSVSQRKGPGSFIIKQK